MGSEVIAGVFPSKAEEHIIAPWERRRGISHSEAVVESWSPWYDGCEFLNHPVEKKKGTHNFKHIYVIGILNEQMKFDYVQKRRL